MKANNRIVVGIDLGTTNSAIAYMQNGQPKLIPSSTGDVLLPSVIYRDEQEMMIVGQDAMDALLAMPSRTVAAVKRTMGSKDPIALGETEFLPEELSSYILKELKGLAEKELESEDMEAVITVPAHFNDAQRKATKEAGQLAGFHVERIVNEPTAAAMAFGLLNLEEDQHVLVYDLGGGTFDVSLVEMMSGIMEVKASSGNNALGGEDFDWKLVDLFAQTMLESYDVDPREDIRARALLKKEAERAKKALSEDNSCAVDLPGVVIKEGEPLSLTMTLSREDFIALIQEDLDETMDCVEKVLQDAQLDRAEVDEILLVGGSTHIPRVREMIEDYFEKPPRSDVSPDEAVAMGAAVQAGLKSGELADSGLIVTDVAPYSMGIAVLAWLGDMFVPGKFNCIIPKNTTIPVTRSDIVTTASHNQTVIEVEVYQGEKQWTKDNYPLGSFLLSGIPPRPAREEKVEVTFTYDINGILEVTARCLSNDKAMGVVLKDALDRETEEGFEESQKRLEDFFKGTSEESQQDEEDTEEEIWSLDHEIEMLRQQIQDLLPSLQGETEEEIRGYLHTLQELENEDEEEIRDILDEIVDRLISLEAGDDLEEG